MDEPAFHTAYEGKIVECNDLFGVKQLLLPLIAKGADYERKEVFQKAFEEGFRLHIFIFGILFSKKQVHHASHIRNNDPQFSLGEVIVDHPVCARGLTEEEYDGDIVFVKGSPAEERSEGRRVQEPLLVGNLSDILFAVSLLHEAKYEK